MDGLWRVELLGKLRASQQDRAISHFERPRFAALFAYLAYYPRSPHPRQALIQELWPECDFSAARNELRKALSSLRHQFEPPGIPSGAVVQADRYTVQLNPAAVTTDVAEFEAALQAAARASSRMERVHQLSEAAELYAGELLPGYTDSWILPERQRVLELFCEALLQLSTCLEQMGDLHGAVHWARRLVSADPLREEAQDRLIRLLAAAGQPEASLDHYREWERLLAEETGDTPSAETRALSRDIDDRRNGGRRDGFVPPLPHESTSPSAPLSGTITFLLTEIADTASLREQLGEAYPAVLEAFQNVLCPLLRGCGGHEVQSAPETLLLAFERPSAALAAAVAAQRALAGQQWPAPAGVFQVRMAIHTGEVAPGDASSRAAVLQHAMRLFLAAHGGQILLSESTAALLRTDQEPRPALVDLGLFRLHEAAPPERLFQANDLESTPPEFPPPLALPGHQGHLPPRLTRFFGREEEIDRLRALLQTPEARLVTLSGVAGCGKTRLAVEVAARLRDAYAGAVWFVRLLDLSAPELIAGKIAETLSLPSPHSGPLPKIVAFLSRQPCLLLLDNFEHLLEGGTELVETLLEQVEALTVLVTSRQRLALPGEREFPLRPLPVPPVASGGTAAKRWSGSVVSQDGDAGPPLATDSWSLATVPSVQLFVDRAQAVKPDFQLTERNAGVLAEICRRLEGLPLAIELAAARVPALEQMLEKLDQRLDLLARPQWRGDPKQRSLRAALDWSYELLPPELRRFFARLSVFRGGWTLEAAEKICGDCGLPIADCGSGKGRREGGKLVLVSGAK